MRKLILISFFSFLLVGCNDKKSKIELPDRLSWDMTINEVEKIGDIGLRGRETRITQNSVRYTYKSNTYKKFDFNSLTFNSDDQLISISFNDNYYSGKDPKLEKSDFRGDKAISLYNSYVSKFDAMYQIKENKDVKLLPEDNFWFKQQSCDEKMCTITQKNYVDDQGTEISTLLAYIKVKDDVVGIVGLNYKNTKQ